MDDRLPEARRILFVDLAPTPGGSVVSLYNLLRGLDRRRYEPLVVLSAHNTFAQQVRELGVPVVALPGHRQGTAEFPAAVQRVRTGRLGRWVQRAGPLLRLWRAGGLALRLARRTLPEAWRLASVVRRTQPHLLHLNNIVALNRAGILAAWATGRPCVCHLRGLNRLEPVDRWLARRVAYYIFISQAVARAQRAEGVPMLGEVIANAVEPGALDQRCSGEELVEAFGFPPGAQVFGMVGRLEPWKGHRVFLQALAQVRRQHPQAVGLVVGGPEPNSPAYPQELSALARELGLGGAVVFAGYRPDVLRLMTGMAAVVHCSTAPEPFGRVIIEGMAAGVPVVASNDGATPEIVENGVSGLLTPPGDAAALAAAMARLLAEPAWAQRLAAQGHAVFQERYTAEQHARQVERIYQRLLGSGQG
ncbi:MAG: glycosyltransferase family 4 protein [Chloroflexi bacterium]|nr:glycosyltransferase family 4 protein [Chloroflexota bacterium]